MVKNWLRISVILLLVVAFSGGAWLPALKAGMSQLEEVLEKYELDRSDERRLLRSYRGAVNVGVDERRLEVIVLNALDSGMEIKYLDRAMVLTTNAVLDGLPAGPMLNKFSEGLAKRVDDDELVEALERRALSLKKARQILSVLIYEERPLGEIEFVIVAVASALERGVSAREVEKAFKEEGGNLRKFILEIEDMK